MGRGRDFRGGPRKRGFDDDYVPFPTRDSDRGGQARSPGFARPSAAPMPMGPPVDATVKWFNSEKGFGFVELADGSGDVFLHVAVLQSAGHESAPPGAKLKVQVGQGAKGRQVTGVLELDASTATAEPPRRAPRPGGFAPRAPRQAPDPSTAIDLAGAVKWFNADKGFGFVQADDGGKDVFVHVSVLERAGLHALAEGQRVSMRVVEAPKGREAISLNVA